MCDMFLILIGTKYFTGDADDNTPFVVRDNIADVIKAVEEIGESLVNWFSNNEIKLNTDKCDCNWTRTQNHLVLKRTLNHLAKLAK